MGVKSEIRFAPISGAGSLEAVAEDFPCRIECGALQVHGVDGSSGAVVGCAAKDALD